jgi:multidrug efflux pump subunit AcrB
VTFPAPDGGKYRQIMVDIDPLKLQARGLTPTDVVNAVSAQNLTLPSGLAKIGDTQNTVRTNAMPVSITDLNNIPVKYINGQTVFLRDVGQVHDGWAVQQNVVRNAIRQFAVFECQYRSRTCISWCSSRRTVPYSEILLQRGISNEPETKTGRCA